MPNRTPASGSLQNFENPQINGCKWASLASRVAHQINLNQSLFFRYGWNHRTDPSSAFYGNDCCRPAGNPTDGQDEFERGNIGGIGYTWVVNPRLVFDARMGYTRYFDAKCFDIRKLGFPGGCTPPECGFRRTPFISLLSYGVYSRKIRLWPLLLLLISRPASANSRQT